MEDERIRIKEPRMVSEVNGLGNWKDGVAISRDDEDSGRSLSVRREVVGRWPGRRCSPAPEGEEVEHQRHRVARPPSAPARFVPPVPWLQRGGTLWRLTVRGIRSC